MIISSKIVKLKKTKTRSIYSRIFYLLFHGVTLGFWVSFKVRIWVWVRFGPELTKIKSKISRAMVSSEIKYVTYKALETTPSIFLNL